MAQASRVNVSQPPVEIAAATQTPAVNASAPPASAPRYGLPTRITPKPPIAATTNGRHRRGTRWARQPAANSIAGDEDAEPDRADPGVAGAVAAE